MTLRSAIVTVTPRSLRRAWNARVADRAQRRLEQLPRPQIFERIYAEGHWGRAPDGAPFSSGLGSHDHRIVGPYVEAVRAYLQEAGPRPDVVDIGCGDFNVGAQIRDVCGAYVACDVAQNVIAHDRRIHAGRDVDFRVVDMVTDDLPEGDVVFVRQVLQHLSNDAISAVLPKLRGYRAAIVTEHLPVHHGFEPNIDIPTGLKIRTAENSGVVLAAPPFSFVARSQRELCLVRNETGTIVTTVYEFDGQR